MQIQPFSPKVYARNAGLLYLLIILAGLFSVVFVRDKLIVSGDAAATAHNVAAHETLWRVGIVSDLLMHLCDIPVMLVVYVLLRPVNRNIALLGLLFNLVQTAVLVANKLHLITALLATDPPQIYNAIRLHDMGFGVGLLFFGCTLLVNGYLVIRSGYLPRWIGVLLQLAGACYLVSNVTLLLAPALANRLFILMLPCLIAELSFCLWLIFKGVDLERFNALAE
jgi:hypothetical protein